MITHSNVLRQRRHEFLEALGPEQLRRVGRVRAGRHHPQSRRCGLRAPTSLRFRGRRPARSTGPAPASTPKTLCTRGLRMSASISSTRWPACASAIARFDATSVFPSPGPVLVTTTSVRPPRRTRTAGWCGSRGSFREIPGDAVVDQRIASAALSKSAGTMPRNGSPRCAFSSSGLLMRLSRYSKKNASPPRQRDAAKQRQQQVHRRVRAHGPARHFRRVDHADIARLQLARDAGFLRPLHQAVEDLAVAGGVALPARRSRSPCG